jgi:phage shock protein PspC (stress-responsive transcriptional regulator)
MNEITKIHLGRLPFTISVEAHKALQAYLTAIKHQAGAKNQEVLKEIETRMAELLTERGIKGDKVVLPEDIDYLKEQLGSPQDFKDDGDESEQTDGKHDKEKDDVPKRLFRDTDHGMVAGVSSGLAAYFGVDAIFVRVFFIFGTVMGGWGLLAYIILWLVVPEAKTSSDVLQMRGKPVTAASLKKVVNQADVPGAAKRATSVIGSIIEGCAKLFLVVIGFAFVIAGAISLLAIVSSSIYLAIRGSAVFQEEIFPIGGTEVLLTVMSLLASAILCLFLVLIGLAMIRRKWLVSGWVVATLLGVLFVSMAVASAMLPDVIPKVRDRYRAAHHVTVRDLEAFSELRVTGRDANFSFKPDSKYYVELRYLGEIETKSIKTSIDDKRLTVDATEFAKQNACKTICLFNDQEVDVIIHAPELTDVVVDGEDADFEINEPLKQPNLTLEASRGASVYLSHVHPLKATLIDRTYEPTVRLLLNGIRPGLIDDEIAIRYDGIYIDRSDELRVQTDRSCDVKQASVLTERTPRSVAVNEEASVSAQAFGERQSRDKENIYNCVHILEVTPLKPGTFDYYNNGADYL